MQVFAGERVRGRLHPSDFLTQFPCGEAGSHNIISFRTGMFAQSHPACHSGCLSVCVCVCVCVSSRSVCRLVLVSDFSGICRIVSLRGQAALEHPEAVTSRRSRSLACFIRKIDECPGADRLALRRASAVSPPLPHRYSIIVDSLYYAIV